MWHSCSQAFFNFINVHDHANATSTFFLNLRFIFSTFLSNHDLKVLPESSQYDLIGIRHLMFINQVVEN
jgi:hypothetical protein